MAYFLLSACPSGKRLDFLWMHVQCPTLPHSIWTFSKCFIWLWFCGHWALMASLPCPDLAHWRNRNLVMAFAQVVCPFRMIWKHINGCLDWGFIESLCNRGKKSRMGQILRKETAEAEFVSSAISGFSLFQCGHTHVLCPASNNRNWTLTVQGHHGTVVLAKSSRVNSTYIRDSPLET